MSALTNPMPLIDTRAYEPLRAEWIANEYASGEPFTGLAQLHAAYPDTVPAPITIRRWRSVWPAFDALMVEAEKARAVALMEATIPIADNVALNAAQAKNAIAARWRMAENLAPDLFGSAKAKGASDDTDAGRLLGKLTDAQLIRIMAGEDVRAVLANDPAPSPLPPSAARPGLSGGSEVIPLPPNFIALEGSAVERPGVPRETALGARKEPETSG